MAGSRLTSSPSTGQPLASRTHRRRILTLAPAGPRQLPRSSGREAGAVLLVRRLPIQELISL